MSDGFAHGRSAHLRYRIRPASGPGRAPLLVFLHGVGECGTDNVQQLSYPFFKDPTSLFGSKTDARFPCHVLAPQAPDGERWVDVPSWDTAELALKPQPTPALRAVGGLIERFLSEPDVDPSRVYVVGLSMGAFGVYDLVARRPELFAAAVAVCGAGDPAEAAYLKRVPFWIAHGALDRGVPVERSRAMEAALRAAGAAVVYKEYADAGHDVWNLAFGDEGLVTWLFSKSRR